MARGRGRRGAARQTGEHELAGRRLELAGRGSPLGEFVEEAERAGRPLDDEVSAGDEGLGRLGARHRDAHAREVAGLGECVDRRERRDVADVIAEDAPGRTSREQRRDDGPLVVSDRKDELDRPPALPDGEAVAFGDLVGASPLSSTKAPVGTRAWASRIAAATTPA